MIVLLLLGIFILYVIIIFAFPRFSPIPYFPSNGKDMSLILKELHIREDQQIIDLGAGDGIIILKAAEDAHKRKLNTKFIAVEINPILLLILHIRRLFHPNRKNIRVINADMFTMDYAPLVLKNNPHITFYMYISPWFIEKTILNITRQIKTFSLVSYFYQVKCLTRHKELMKEGVHDIFTYSP